VSGQEYERRDIHRPGLRLRLAAQHVTDLRCRASGLFSGLQSARAILSRAIAAVWAVDDPRFDVSAMLSWR